MVLIDGLDWVPLFLRLISSSQVVSPYRDFWVGVFGVQPLLRLSIFLSFYLILTYLLA